MAEKSYAAKLFIKPGTRVFVLNLPPEDAALLDELPEGVVIEKQSGTGFDVVIAFMVDSAAVETTAAATLASARADAVIWLAYPKRTGRIQTDINRDNGWEPVMALGYGPVSQISLGDTWSALRWRREADVKRKPNSVVAPRPKS